MRPFDNMMWLFLTSLLLWGFYILRITFVLADNNLRNLRRPLTGWLIAAFGVASTLTPIGIAMQQIASILGFAILIPPAVNIWQRLKYQVFERVAVVGAEIGLLGSVSTKLMILGGGLPSLCHIPADLLACIGAYSISRIDKSATQQHTDTT